MKKAIIALMITAAFILGYYAGVKTNENLVIAAHADGRSKGYNQKTLEWIPAPGVEVTKGSNSAFFD